MSRLVNHRRATQTKRAIIMSLIVIFLFIAAFQIGLKSIINTILFVNTFQSSESTGKPAREDELFYGTFIPVEPPVATREPQLIVSGQIQGYEKVTAFLNGSKKTSAAVTNEQYEITVTDLRQNENSLYLVAATRDGKHTKKSPVYTVSYLNTPPTLEFESPSDQATVKQAELEVKGKTAVGVSLKINRAPVVVDWQGNFRTRLRLKEGENTIEAHAQDDAGNEVEKKITVRYQRDE